MQSSRGYLSVLMVSAFCFGLVEPLPANTAEAAGPALYAGGVTGIKDLLDPANSQMFRASGGGLYLHNSGWGKLAPEERKRILQIFGGSPVAVELGFGSGAAWGKIYREHYVDYGVRPTFIAVNAVKDPGFPSPDQWRQFSDALRSHGAAASTSILPIFLLQNSKRNIATLMNNTVSSSPAFQSIIAAGRGMVLDTPPQYVFAREPAYREWVVDALHWTNRHGLMSVVILSPHFSRTKWGNDTLRYVRFLQDHDAIPATFVCENYVEESRLSVFGATASTYPNVVGSDRVPYNALGNCELLRRQNPSRPRVR